MEKKRLITISYREKTGQVMYHFGDGTIKRVKVRNNKVKSACKEYPNAELYEREIGEKFNIIFVGHPNQERLFIEE